MMKRLAILLLILMHPVLSIAQTPLGINYQGIARSGDGSPLINQDIGLRMSITAGPDGSTDYVEEHHVTTNDFGLFRVIVGDGQSGGSLNDVDWIAGNKWLLIEIDPQDQDNYMVVGSQQLLSVPYALFAAQSGSELSPGVGIDISGGKVNNVLPDQLITLEGQGAATVTGAYPNFRISTTDNVEDADASPTNEIQSLTLNGTNLELTDGGIVDLSGFVNSDGQNLADVLTQGADANGAIISGLSDPLLDQDAATKGYVDGQSILLSTDISTNSTAINTESAARTVADDALQNELNATQTGAGLNSNGTYSPPGSSNFLGTASSLKDADSRLDLEISNNASSITTLTSRLDNTYAFSADFTTIAASATTKSTVNLVESLDNFNQVSSSEVVIGASGLYMIVVDAERNNFDANFNSLYLSINTSDSNLPVFVNGLNIGKTVIRYLNSGDTVRVLITTAGAITTPFNGTIGGYKISD